MEGGTERRAQKDKAEKYGTLGYSPGTLWRLERTALPRFAREPKNRLAQTLAETSAVSAGLFSSDADAVRKDPCAHS